MLLSFQFIMTYWTLLETSKFGLLNLLREYTIQNVDTEVYIEEYSADVENEVSPDEDILENGFSRQVTFYEKD